MTLCIDKQITDKIQISIACDKNYRWIAWLVGNSPNMRLYVAFPGRSESVISLPYAIESNIVKIGIDPINDFLAILSESGIQMFALNDMIIDQILSSIYSDYARFAGFGDMDSLGRFRMWLPSIKTVKQNNNIEWSVPGDILISLSEPVQSVQGLVWISESEIAIKRNDRWSIVNIFNATKRNVIKQESEQTNLLLDKQKADIFAANPQGEKRPGCYVANDEMIEASFENSYSRPDLNINVRMSSKRIPKKNKDGTMGPSDYTTDPNSIFITYDGIHRRYSTKRTVSNIGGVSKSGRLFALSSTDGNRVFILYSKGLATVGIINFQNNSSSGTILTPDNYYLASDGKANGVSLTSGLNGMNLSQFEVQMNRPDIVLERLGAPPAMVKEAARLRERFLKRSDYKALGTVDLIDIPVVDLTSQPSTTTENREVKVEFKCSNNTGPLKEILIYNNGSLVEKKPLSAADGKASSEASGQTTVALASGDNLIQLCAVSEEGVPSAFTPARVKCTALPQSKNSYIVCVGLSEYQNREVNLKYAAKDAFDMSAVLEKAARGRGFQPKVLLLRNQEVTPEIVDKIRSFLATATTDDEVTLFFAGHGLLDKDLGYQFATYTTDFTATENQGIPFEKLESLVEGIKPLKRTVLLDTCHSGEVEEESKPELLAMVNGASSPAPAEVAGVKKSSSIATRGMRVSEAAPKLRHSDFVQLESLFPDSRRAKGANILTSSSGSEFSMESDAWKNGLFTYTFLNALKDPKSDRNEDGNVTFEEIATTVSERVSSLSGGSQRPITRGVNREVPSVLAHTGGRTDNSTFSAPQKSNFLR